MGICLVSIWVVYGYRGYCGDMSQYSTLSPKYWLELECEMEIKVKTEIKNQDEIKETEKLKIKTDIKD